MLSYLLENYIEENGRITKDWSKLSTININRPIIDVDDEMSHIKTFEVEAFKDGDNIPYYVIAERQAWLLDLILAFNDAPSEVVANNINLITFESLITHLTPEIFGSKIVECVYKVIDFDALDPFIDLIAGSPQWFEYLEEISKRMDISIKNTGGEEDPDIERIHQILDALAFDIIHENRFGFVTDIYPSIDLSRIGLVSTASAILRYAAGENILDRIPTSNISYISLALESILDGTEDCSDIIRATSVIHDYILGNIEQFERDHIPSSTEEDESYE